jgi:hypothetical protein
MIGGRWLAGCRPAARPCLRPRPHSSSADSASPSTGPRAATWVRIPCALSRSMRLAVGDVPLAQPRVDPLPTRSISIAASARRPRSSCPTSSAAFSSRRRRSPQRFRTPGCFSPPGSSAACSRSRVRWRMRSSRRCGHARAVNTCTCARRMVRAPHSSPAGRRLSPGSRAPSPRAPWCWRSTWDALCPLLRTRRRSSRSRSCRGRSCSALRPRRSWRSRRSSRWRGSICAASGRAHRGKLARRAQVLALVVFVALGFALGDGTMRHLAESVPVAPAGWLLALIPVIRAVRRRRDPRSRPQRTPRGRDRHGGGDREPAMRELPTHRRKRTRVIPRRVIGSASGSETGSPVAPVMLARTSVPRQPGGGAPRSATPSRRAEEGPALARDRQD